MRKNLLLSGAFFMGLALSSVLVSCGDDDEDNNTTATTTTTDNGNSVPDPNAGKEAADVVYSPQNATAWGNYMAVVAKLLKDDSADLYASWATSKEYDGKSYAQYFLSHDNEDFSKAVDCVSQIIDGCVDIASEVGDSKIGDPVALYKDGKTTEALYAVESWYSWHSIEDYANNIRSIRNAYYGSRNGSVNANSLSAVVAANNQQLNQQVVAAIDGAIAAIEGIPAPFRNNIGSEEAQKAASACKELGVLLDETLKTWFQNTAAVNTHEVLDPVLSQYVNGVVLPTYLDLKNNNEALYNTVLAFQRNPSNATFEACANAWFVSRTPWESSEAFLYGPVADKGLDPNMDSWPLDQAGIVQILNSSDWNALEWKGEYDEDSEEIEGAQSLRGFHTLEFLIFQNGKARTIQ